MSLIEGAFLISLAAGAAACSGNDSGLFDPSTFAGMNEALIRLDCQQTVDCDNTSDRGSHPAGWYDECVRTAAMLLNGDLQRQSDFLTKYTRCQLRSGCDYETCTMNPPVNSYGQTQIDKITYHCQAKAQCTLDMGNTLDNPDMAISNCAAIYVGQLDTWSAQQRANYEQSFAGCSMLASCDFLACFNF